MFNRKRIISVVMAGTMALGMMFSSVTVNAASTKNYIITSPYENVNWATFGQYKAGLHAHSTNSDGGNLTKDMVEDHYKKGYDILAMTDHNYTTTSWDKVAKGAMTPERVAEIEAGVGRDGRGMIHLDNTNEQSVKDHINSFFIDFNNQSGATMRSTLKTVEDGGGITHINHPGRYTGGSSSNLVTGAAASNNPTQIKKYVDLYKEFNSCVGMEIINKMDNESRSDRILWDNNLKEMMPEGRFVFGFSNDDTHSLDSTGYAFNIMLMPELTQKATRTAMETGAFYAVSRIDRRENINATLPGGGSTPGNGTSATLFMLQQSTPSISNIIVDQKADTITISGADYDTIEWIADGVKIATGETLRLNDYEDKINSYVRAQLKSSTGIAFTQPFGVKEAANELNLSTDAHLVKKGNYFNVMPSFDYSVNSNAATLEFSFDSTKFEYRGFTSAEGVSLLNSETGVNSLKLTVMVEDYSTKDYGKVLFSAKEDVDLENTDNTIEVKATYVVKADDDTKTIETATASTTFTSVGDLSGDVNHDGKVNLLDLSDIIDVFGITSSDSRWSTYRFFDLNGNGTIDIQDISEIAKLIK